MIALVGLDGPVKGKTFFLKNFPFRIGRGPKNHLALPDSHSSANHSMIVNEDEGVFVVDLGSTNGTVVNGKPVDRVALRQGDTIMVGRSRFRVDFGGFTTTPHLRDTTVCVSPGADLPSRALTTLRDFDHTFYMRPQGDAEALRKSYKALRILYSADSIMADVRDFEATLARVIELVATVFEAERALILLLDPESGEIRFQTQRPKDGGILVSATVSTRVLNNHESVLSQDAMLDERFAKAQSIMRQGVRSVMCVPLKSADRVLGLIYLDRSTEANRYDEDDLKLLTAIGGKAGIGVENALLYRDVQSLFVSTIETIVDTIRAKDVYTRGHSERVRAYAAMIGEALGLDAKQRHTLELAAVLHDVGKIGMPDRLLYNTDALSPSEYGEIKLHPVQGAELLSKIERLKEVVPIVRHHHEAVDGSGYPDGLKADQIPFLSKVIAIADTYDACTTDRPYQKGMPREEAIRILRGAAGKRLDARLVEAFVEKVTAAPPVPSTVRDGLADKSDSACQ